MRVAVIYDTSRHFTCERFTFLALYNPRYELCYGRIALNVHTHLARVKLRMNVCIMHWSGVKMPIFGSVHYYFLRFVREMLHIMVKLRCSYHIFFVAQRRSFFKLFILFIRNDADIFTLTFVFFCSLQYRIKLACVSQLCYSIKSVNSPAHTRFFFYFEPLLLCKYIWIIFCLLFK